MFNLKRTRYLATDGASTIEVPYNVIDDKLLFRRKFT